MMGVIFLNFKTILSKGFLDFCGRWEAACRVKTKTGVELFLGEKCFLFQTKIAIFARLLMEEKIEFFQGRCGNHVCHGSSALM